MAYGVDSEINERVDMYSSDPQKLAQRYAQSQSLLDLLALQKLKSEKEAAMRNMQGQMQTPMNTVREQTEQQVFDMTRNEVAQQAQQGAQQLALNQQREMQARGIPTQAAPNMRGMMGGGIVGYQAGGEVGERGLLEKIGRTFLGDESYDILRQQSESNKANTQMQPPMTESERVTYLQNLMLKRKAAGATDAEIQRIQEEIDSYYVGNLKGSGLKGFEGGGIVGYAGPNGSYVGANNPFNLRDYSQDWQGQTGNTRGFVDFADERSGVRAADILLNNYGELQGIDTLRGAISRFAPPNENVTEDYIAFVAEQTGINSEQPIDLSDATTRRRILSAMGKMESGYSGDIEAILADESVDAPAPRERTPRTQAMLDRMRMLNEPARGLSPMGIRRAAEGEGIETSPRIQQGLAAKVQESQDVVDQLEADRLEKLEQRREAEEKERARQLGLELAPVEAEKPIPQNEGITADMYMVPRTVDGGGPVGDGLAALASAIKQPSKLEELLAQREDVMGGITSPERLQRDKLRAYLLGLAQTGAGGGAEALTKEQQRQDALRVGDLDRLIELEREDVKMQREIDASMAEVIAKNEAELTQIIAKAGFEEQMNLAGDRRKFIADVIKEIQKNAALNPELMALEKAKREGEISPDAYETQRLNIIKSLLSGLPASYDIETDLGGGVSFTSGSFE